MRAMLTQVPSRISKNKKILEKKLSVKIALKGKKMEIIGDEFNEFIASRVIEALEANFPLEIALLLKNEDYILEHLNIKEISRRNKRSDVRARVIGKEGRTIELIGELSDSYITLNKNQVSVIGPADKIEITIHALKALIRGSKQSSVYSYLERQKRKQFDDKILFKEDD